MKNCQCRDRWGCTHIVGRDPFYRETRKRIKTFFGKSWKFFSGAMASLIAPEKSEVKWHNLPRNLCFCRRKPKFTVPNLLPAEEPKDSKAAPPVKGATQRYQTEWSYQIVSTMSRRSRGPR